MYIKSSLSEMKNHKMPLQMYSYRSFLTVCFITNCTVHRNCPVLKNTCTRDMHAGIYEAVVSGLCGIEMPDYR